MIKDTGHENKSNDHNDKTGVKNLCFDQSG